MVSDISSMVDAVWDMEKKRQRVAAEEALRTLARLFMPYRMIVTYPLNERSQEELSALETALREASERLAEYRSLHSHR